MPLSPHCRGEVKISIEKNNDKIYKNIFVYFYLLMFYY